MIPPGWNVIEKFEMKKQNKEILEPLRWRVGGETAASVVSNGAPGSAPARTWIRAAGPCRPPASSQALRARAGVGSIRRESLLRRLAICGCCRTPEVCKCAEECQTMHDLRTFLRATSSASSCILLALAPCQG